jgi:hypothetical protein
VKQERRERREGGVSGLLIDALRREKGGPASGVDWREEEVSWNKLCGEERAYHC